MFVLKICSNSKAVFLQPQTVDPKCSHSRWRKNYELQKSITVPQKYMLKKLCMKSYYSQNQLVDTEQPYHMTANPTFTAVTVKSLTCLFVFMTDANNMYHLPHPLPPFQNHTIFKNTFSVKVLAFINAFEHIDMMMYSSYYRTCMQTCFTWSLYYMPRPASLMK